MNILIFAYKNIKHQWLSMGLSIMLSSLGIGLLVFVLIFNHQIQENVENNLAKTDIVIGAKGSPLQMVLSSLFHIDNPNGNIKLSKIKAYLSDKHPLIKTAIPLSVGDNYHGFRIVGTTKEFGEYYGVMIRSGHWWTNCMEVVVGHGVAKSLGLKLGDKFHSSHGMVHEYHLSHQDKERFRVVGILEQSNSIADRLILTTTSSFWKIHEEHEEGHLEEKCVDLDNQALARVEDKDITALLIRFRYNNFQSLNFARLINENTEMIAASPSYEINQLYLLMGNGFEFIQLLAYLIGLVAFISLSIAIYQSLQRRKYELALLRVMSASKLYVYGLICLEGAIVALFAAMMGWGFAHLFIYLLPQIIDDWSYYYFDALIIYVEEIWIVLISLILAIIAGLIPAIIVYRTDIHQIFANRGE